MESHKQNKTNQNKERPQQTPPAKASLRPPPAHRQQALLLPRPRRSPWPARPAPQPMRRVKCGSKATVGPVCRRTGPRTPRRRRPRPPLPSEGREGSRRSRTSSWGIPSAGGLDERVFPSPSCGSSGFSFPSGGHVEVPLRTRPSAGSPRQEPRGTASATSPAAVTLVWRPEDDRARVGRPGR